MIALFLLLACGSPAPHPCDTHPGAAQMQAIAPFPAAGPDACFALRELHSDFDHETAPRPYVYRVPREGRVVDLWRGTALSYPLVAAEVRQVDGESLVCALHRGDSFLDRHPETPLRRTKPYAWTGFGFRGRQDAGALEACAAAFPPT